jgi:hypothetical protein
MSNLFTIKSLSFTIAVTLLIISLPQFIQSSFGKTKEEFYEELESLCYPNDLYEKLHETYEMDSFYWTDFFFNKMKSKKKFIFKHGTTFLFKNKAEKSTNMSYSSNQAIEFYQTYVDVDDYKFGINTEKTFLNNPESRNYLMSMNACTFYKTNFGYNYLNYAKEKQEGLSKDIFELGSEEDYSMSLFKIMYQLARGMFFVFNNDHYYSELSLEMIKYANYRNFKSFKFKNPTKIR